MTVQENIVRDSLIVAAMVVFGVYAIAVAINLLGGNVPSGQVPVHLTASLAALLLVLGLGWILWRSTEQPARS